MTVAKIQILRLVLNVVLMVGIKAAEDASPKEAAEVTAVPRPPHPLNKIAKNLEIPIIVPEVNHVKTEGMEKMGEPKSRVKKRIPLTIHLFMF